MPWVVAIFVIALTVGLDRYTKLIFMQSTQSGLRVFPGILETTTHKNFGIVANLPIPRLIILVLTVSILIVLGFFTFRSLRQRRLSEGCALALIMGGALGNLWDRLQWGFVFDWLLLFGRSIINIADIAIAVGLVWFLWRRRTSSLTSSL